ncbi:hypothetical protein [Streptomonospora wellingtoniae]|uniref:Rhodanese domain-containing protein n=1 Tax=Streptomonospora wellingtoniae TaxID=3075544 RepID=A0ABU2L045_9ACTN|nr:hypothetical protein [Streptomonospora sp. DSM 45055]MDT0304929.1 hypothetical protein [Streptomonospora sp. DSM 45055]
MRSPLSRTCRAAVFAAVAVGVSGTGHAVMSAHHVPFTGFAVGFAAVFAAAAAAAGKERGYWVILGWMAWSQLALHLVFALAQGSADPATIASAHSGAAAATGPGTGPGGHGGGSDAGMLLWHTAAGLLSSWWLRRGEAAAAALARHVRALLLPPLLPAPRWRPTRRPAPCTCVPRSLRVATPVLRYALVVRGPPPSLSVS